LLLDDLAAIGEVTERVEGIQKALSAPIQLGFTEIFTTASVGIAQSSKGYRMASDMLRDADTALARAKRAGRDRTATFQTGMRLEAMRSFRMETDLRRAIRQNEFLVHYQPIVDLVSGALSGFEALVRWQHPERGVVSPAEFVPLAERLGLIVPIDRWVFEQAAKQASSWQRDLGAELTMSVNVSSKQFADTDLVAHVAEILESTDLDPRMLKLEITESAVVDNPDQAAAMLTELKEMGIRLCLDDFGTGYSSLAHLHRFPFDVLKIDRSFVSRMGIEASEPGIVRSIIDLAEGLNMEVVAEGVETNQQYAMLREMGCLLGQGYLFARPLESDDAWRLMRAETRW
jgi:EAL domain-containing protein (putative c-di-GMP-specific phosphodiesterase class I)